MRPLVRLLLGHASQDKQAAETLLLTTDKSMPRHEANQIMGQIL